MPDRTELFETQVLDALKQSQDALVETVRTWAQAVQRALPEAARTPELRHVDRLPDPAVVLGEVFDFAEALLKSQREFALRLLEATEPLTRSVGVRVGKRSARARPRRARPAPVASREPASKHGADGARSA